MNTYVYLYTMCSYICVNPSVLPHNLSKSQARADNLAEQLGSKKEFIPAQQAKRERALLKIHRLQRLCDI